jgi:hypothetical protein
MVGSQHESAVVTTTVNYRSYKDIGRLASKLFYYNKMVAEYPDDDIATVEFGPLKRKFGELHKWV